jgi:hypothetical protein
VKLFGYYIFEDSPEMKDYRATWEEHERRSMASVCEMEGPRTPIKLPNAEGDYLPVWGPVDSKKENLKRHQELASQGRCHKFNGKKFCYHTGKEIVSDI